MLKRSIKITFRLNAQECQLLKKQVKKSGLSQESYIRTPHQWLCTKGTSPSRLLRNDEGASLYW
ncbi:MAG: plasmid mobilization protein [Acetivibrionales bacterium]